VSVTGRFELKPLDIPALVRAVAFLVVAVAAALVELR
jgi:hypothetical protein